MASKPKPVHREKIVTDTAPRAATDSPAAVPPSVAVSVAEPAKTDTVITATDSLHARFKDGRYRGWGYSQHGNMEVEVEIQDGRVVNTYITQCLTAWSCTYVRKLQAQVLERQSAEVDTISGATNSADAFYFATFTALNKARTT